MISSMDVVHAEISHFISLSIQFRISSPYLFPFSYEMLVDYGTYVFYFLIKAVREQADLVSLYLGT